MRRHLLSALLLSLTLSVSLSVSLSAAAQDAGEDAMLAQINAARQAQQLPPLVRSAELDAVARAHSTEMAQNGALAHVSDTTGSPEDRVRAAGLSTSTVAENVAMHRDAGQAQQALVASPPHLGNMMSTDATHVGIGVAPSPQGVYVTQVFAALPASAPAAPALPAVEAAPAAPEFGIIPPFVENAIEQADEITAPVLDAVPEAPVPAAPVLDPLAASEAPPPAPTVQAPVVEDPFGAAPSAPAAPAPVAAAPAAPEAAAPAAPETVQVSPEAATSLQQLFNMGMSILRGAPTTAAAN